jgi:hypothetical protein
MHPTDPICPVCGQAVPTAVPVIFDHGEIIHLDCYVGIEGVAPMVQAFLDKRPHEQFCYTCLAQRLTRDGLDIRKAATALRLNRRALVEPAICSDCAQARVTIRMRAVP